MYITRKYRIYPNSSQKELMEKFFGCSRFIYNKCIEHYSVAYTKWKKNGTKFEKTPLITDFKKKYPFLKECNNAALAYSRSNFERSISNMIKSKNGIRNGKKTGFPKFKKKGVCVYSYRTCDSHGGIRFDDKNTHLRIPKLKFVKIVKHREYDGIIKSVTVNKTKTQKYYAILTIESQSPIIKEKLATAKKESVGLDMSLKNFAVSSSENDNMIIKYCHNYRMEEKRIKKLNRGISRKKAGGNNREKAKLRYARLCEKISERRKDFVIKTALYYSRNYKNIIIEDLNMNAMSRTLRLGKSVMDLGWGIFRQWLIWESEKHGSNVIIADKWFASSKICNCCGAKNTDLKLSEREWTCKKCGSVIDRDYNAACNLRDYYLKRKNTVGTTEINACGNEANTEDDFSLTASFVNETRRPLL